MDTGIKKVVTINDMSGLGKCSLTVAIPILAILGIESCPFPTAILSCQTGYPKYSFLDFTEEMINYERSWEELGFKFDCIYSGFLGSEKQIDIVLNFMLKHSESLIFVDPVMGDHGKLYGTYTSGMCNKIKNLIKYAHIVTPNLTEACILTEKEYDVQALNLSLIKNMAKDISAMGPKKVVITGIVEGDSISNLAYDSTDDIFIISKSKYNNMSYSGTGDIFASILCGMLVKNYDFDVAVNKASTFIEHAIEHTSKFNILGREGIMYEPFLRELML
ncbi:MAG: pyridoxamine kinase [Clostridium sp.]